MRQKILVILLTLLTILTSWTWYENTYRIDFFATKNRHLRNQKRIEIINEGNIDSLRQKAVKILDNYEQHHDQSDKAVLEIQDMLTLTTCLTLLTLILLIFEFRKKIGS
jgi:hypothetical protein